MTEETHNAAMAGPIGIVMAIGVSAVLGWFLILGLLFSIQDLDRTVNTTTGEPVAQIFLDTVGEKGAIVLMVSILWNLACLCVTNGESCVSCRSSSSVLCSSVVLSLSHQIVV